MLKNSWKNGQDGIQQTDKCFTVSNQRATNGERLQNEKEYLQTHFFIILLCYKSKIEQQKIKLNWNVNC